MFELFKEALNRIMSEIVIIRFGSFIRCSKQDVACLMGCPAPLEAEYHGQLDRCKEDNFCNWNHQDLLY